MNEPHKCPKCNGTGFLQFDPTTGFQVATTMCGPWQCDVCQSGIIWSYDSFVPDYKLPDREG